MAKYKNLINGLKLFEKYFFKRKFYFKSLIRLVGVND
tara:strand:- start:106 stop:216 length:111 start_codon:yes stop_codon:yes gene_type:complete